MPAHPVPTVTKRPAWAQRVLDPSHILVQCLTDERLLGTTDVIHNYVKVQEGQRKKIHKEIVDDVIIWVCGAQNCQAQVYQFRISSEDNRFGDDGSNLSAVRMRYRYHCPGGEGAHTCVQRTGKTVYQTALTVCPDKV